MNAVRAASGDADYTLPTRSERMNTPPAMLHPELLAPDGGDTIVRDGRRLDHAEAASKPLRSRPEPQPRGAKVHGNRPIDQAEAAARFIAAPEHEKMHDERLWDLRQKRDREMHGIAEWEELRSLASAIKEHTLTHLDEYLEQFEANARSNGINVHWARDAAEHNRIVHGILSDHGAKSLIKSKSMLTEECGFRHYMASVGVEVVETDLGERIQQLDNEDPSHVVVPAVHKLRTDVAEVFAKTIGTDPANSDVHYLAEAQREATRPLILNADAGMTGCNFAVAETGTFVVCTNEGNADLSANVPKLHIASIGIEKIIPRLEHLAVFVRLLSRSALGSPVTQYTSHFRGPRSGGEMHVVLVDNGRSERSGPGGVLDVAQMHPLRRVHEHLPGLPAQRRPQLWRHLLRPDRLDHRPDLQPAQIQQPALRFDVERQLHQRLSGKDQYSRADLCVAPGAGGAARDSARQAGRDESRGRIVVASRRLSRRNCRRRYRTRPSAAFRDLQRPQCLGKAPRGAARAQTDLSQLVPSQSRREKMSSRDDILASIRANLPRVDRPLPAVPSFDDNPPASLLEAFKKSLHQMGGIFLDPPASGDALAPVREKIAGAKIVCSTVSEIAGNRDIAGVGAPQDLADVDFAIVRASFAVAETGSVLLSEADLHVNAVAYLAQHLIVLLDPADIVVNLHHAYRRPEFRDTALRLLPYRTLRHGGHRRRADPRRARRALTFRPAARTLCGQPRISQRGPS